MAETSILELERGDTFTVTEETKEGFIAPPGSIFVPTEERGMFRLRNIIRNAEPGETFTVSGPIRRTFGSKATTVVESHSGINSASRSTATKQNRTTTNARTGEPLQPGEASKSVSTTEASEPTDVNESMSTGDPYEQATRLLSGAGGGGPTGQATEGVNPSAGSISGMSGSILPANFRPRDHRWDGPVPDRVPEGMSGNGVMGLPVVALLALVALFVALLGR